MRSLLILAAATAAFISTPASAQDAAPNIVIHYADLDLATHAGVATLDRRISAGVSAACGPTSDADPAGKNRARACRKDIAAQVRAQRERVLTASVGSGAIVLASTR